MAIFLRGLRRKLEQQRLELESRAAKIDEQRGSLSQRQVEVTAEARRLEREKGELKALRSAIAERERQVRLLIRDRVAAFELLADTWADWEFVQGERAAFDLLYEPHPRGEGGRGCRSSGRAAQRALRRELSLATSARALYEYRYPWLVDFLADEWIVEYGEADDYVSGKEEPGRQWVAKAEWERLPEVDRNQLALERWVRSRRANPWEVGVDLRAFRRLSTRAGWLGGRLPRCKRTRGSWTRRHRS